MLKNPFEMLRDGSVPLYLAPQAGVSESPFRRLCRSFGADVVVSEFVSAEGIRRNDRRTHSYLRFHDDERPIGIQIFGADAEAMAEAAALVEEVYAPDYLDINFGCPVKKVALRTGGVDERWWVSKAGHHLIRSREPFGGSGDILQLDLVSLTPAP